MIVRTPDGQVWERPVVCLDLLTGVGVIAASSGLIGHGRICLLCLLYGGGHQGRPSAWLRVEEVS